MEDPIVVAGVIASGAGIGWFVGVASCYFMQRAEIRYLRDELKVTHAQIAHAVMSEGTQVPPRVEEIELPEPLTEELQECVDQWDTAESRMVEETKIRGWLAEGWGSKAIIRQYRVGDVM